MSPFRALRFRRCALVLLALLAVFAVLIVVALAVWWIDRSQMIDWVGGTNLEVEFLVTASDSGQPIPNARIEVVSRGGVYDGGDKEETFELRTDRSGTAHRLCRSNCCTGVQSRLRFTDTYHVVVPFWRVRVFASGHQASAWVDLAEEYEGKVTHEGPQRDRLVVRIALQKVAVDPGVLPD
jgi:hypothetical protein